MISPAVASRRVSVLRGAGAVALGLRAAVLVAAALAVSAVVAAPGPAPDVLVLLALALAPISVGLPDSPVPAVFCFVVGASFALTSDGRIDVSIVVAALALLVVHVGCALAAAAPLPSSIDAAVARQWLRPTLALAVLTSVAAGILAGLRSWGPAGSIGVTIGALVTAAGLAWWWSDPGPPGTAGDAPERAGPPRFTDVIGRPTIRGRRG